jgi:hypothetical protein
MNADFAATNQLFAAVKRLKRLTGNVYDLAAPRSYDATAANAALLNPLSADSCCLRGGQYR